MNPYPIKLVRDRTGEDVGGGTIVYELADHEDHIRLLRRKLIEESIEYLEDPSVRELADILTVVGALAEVDLQIDWIELLEACDDKVSRRGSFSLGVIMSIMKESSDGQEEQAQGQEEVSQGVTT